MNEDQAQEQTLVVAIRMASVGLFGVASIARPVAAVGSAILATALLALSLQPDRIRNWGDRRVVSRVALVVSVVSIASVGMTLGLFSLPVLEAQYLAIWMVTVGGCTVLYAIDRRRARQLALTLSVVLLIGLSVGVMIRFGGNVYGLDPYLSHEAAADALREGLNPYTDAVLVPNGSPNADPGEVIEGYSYPPVTLVVYSFADWLLGDPRWASVLAIFIVTTAALAWSRGAWSGIAGGVFTILVASPTARSIVWSGWTEPITLVALVGAVLAWRRPVASAVLLGLALSTKQYMVMLIPVLVWVEWRDRTYRRSIIAIGTAAITLVPFAVWDLEAFWSVMVVRPLGLGSRVDSQSLSGALNAVGLNVEIPTAVMLVVVVVVSWWIAHQPTTKPSDVLSAFALVLAIVFLFSMAFTNYWWLVQWVVAGSVILMISTAPHPRVSEINAQTDA